MKFILQLLFFLLIVSFAIAITALFLPDQFKVVRKAEINASPVIVFNRVNNFYNWDSWSPWREQDSLMKTDIGSKSIGKGAKYSWQSAKFGNTDVSITHSVFPESIALNFDNHSKSKIVALIYFEPTAKGTLINFTLNIKKLEFWEKYFLLLSQKEIENIVESGVYNLKSISEELKYSRISEIRIDSISAKHAVIKLDSTTSKNLDANRRADYAYLDRFFERREITPMTPPIQMIFDSGNDTLIKFAVGKFIPERTWVWRTLQYYFIPEGRAVIASHYGKPKTKKAHQAIKSYISEHHLKIKGLPWEEYLYNPKTDKDTSLWEIKIYYPVE